MQTITDDHLYSWVRNSELFRSFDLSDFYNGEVSVPKRFLPTKIKVSSPVELKQTMNMLRYWMIDELPTEIYKYVYGINDNDKNIVKEILTDYFKDFFFEDLTLIMNIDINNMVTNIFINNDNQLTINGIKISSRLRKHLCEDNYIKPNGQTLANAFKYWKLPNELSEIMKKSNENNQTYMSGSFLLAYMTRSYFENNYKKKWYPKDIDIFTNDKSLVGILSGLADNTQIIFDDNSNNQYMQFEREKSYFFTSSMIKIVNLTFDTGTYLNTKLQIILVDSDVKDYIDKFDLDFIKSYYDGETIHVQNLNSILTKTSSINDTFQNRCKFERSVKRIRKYKKRGYTINVPKIIKLDESMKTDKFKNYIKKMRYSGEIISYWYEKIDDNTLQQIKEIKAAKHYNKTHGNDESDDSDDYAYSVFADKYRNKLRRY
jgi:hypothetical protein